MLNLANTAPGLDIRWDWRDMIRALDLDGGGDACYSYGIDKQRTRKHIERNGGGSEDRIYLDGYELYRRRDAHNARSRRSNPCICSKASSACSWSMTYWSQRRAIRGRMA